MPPDVEHFDRKLCTCQMISNGGFSVTKISPSKHHAEPLYDGKSWILSSQMIMSNNRDGLSLLTHTFGIIWHSGVRHQVAATELAFTIVRPQESTNHTEEPAFLVFQCA